MEEKILQAIDEERLLDTAVALIEIPSPTLSAGAAADKLAEILAAEGFVVERPETAWPEAPAVIARYDSGQPGRVLQFDGHLGLCVRRLLPLLPSRCLRCRRHAPLAAA